MGMSLTYRRKTMTRECLYLPEGVNVGQISDGFHTFDQLYGHRNALTAALLNTADELGLKAGWSLRHDDGELCFGGGWKIAWIELPSGKEIRYHLPGDFVLPARLEKQKGTAWNGIDETIDGLSEFANLRF